MKNTLKKLAVGAVASAMTFGSTMGAVAPVFAQTIGTVQPVAGFASNLGNIITFVLRLTMFVAVLLVLFYLVYGAIEWITSGGEKSKTEAARNKITTAVIGLIILAATYAIFTLILQIFFQSNDIQSAFNTLNLDQPINQL